MNMKFVFALIIIDGLLFNCIKAIPTLKRSNRVSREATLSLSKMLKLVSDFYATAKDGDKALIDGVQLLSAIENMVYTIGSTPYHVTQNVLNRFAEVVSFGLHVPGKIENIAMNTVLEPYHLIKNFLNMLGQGTMETANYGLHMQRQIINGAVNVALLPYSATKGLLNWIGL